MRTTVTSTSGHMGTPLHLPGTCTYTPVRWRRKSLIILQPSVTYILSPSDWYSDINIIINKRYQVLKLTSHLIFTPTLMWKGFP